MITQLSILIQAKDRMEELKNKYCVWKIENEEVSCECKADATTCPVAEALKIEYPKFLFCPWCGAYQEDIVVREYDSTKDKQSELDDKPKGNKRLVPTVTGGWIDGFKMEIDGKGGFGSYPYPTLLSCPKCVAGKLFKRKFFDFEGSTLCHLQRWFEYKKKERELIENYHQTLTKGG